MGVDPLEEGMYADREQDGEIYYEDRTGNGPNLRRRRRFCKYLAFPFLTIWAFRFIFVDTLVTVCSFYLCLKGLLHIFTKFNNNYG